MNANEIISLMLKSDHSDCDLTSIQAMYALLPDILKSQGCGLMRLANDASSPHVTTRDRLLFRYLKPKIVDCARWSGLLSMYSVCAATVISCQEFEHGGAAGVWACSGHQGGQSVRLRLALAD